MNCFVCNLPIEGEVYEVYTQTIDEKKRPWDNFYSTWDYQPHHLDCLHNSDKPDEYRVCDTCHKTGKDDTNTYPSPYVQGYIQHAGCVDWDDIRKYGRIGYDND